MNEDSDETLTEDLATFTSSVLDGVGQPKDGQRKGSGSVAIVNEFSDETLPEDLATFTLSVLDDVGKCLEL